jgi:hypothetical protein
MEFQRYSWTPGLTVEDCQRHLAHWLGLWCPRSDWKVERRDGKWHAANEKFSLKSHRLYEESLTSWCEELAERMGLRG